MSSRYQTLYKSGVALCSENVPVLIMASALLKDSETGRVIAQIKFKSITEKVISALKVSVRAFEPNGDEIAGISDFAYLDLNTARDSEFGSKTPIYLPNENARKISVEVTEVTFSNGETERYSLNAIWRPLPEPTPLGAFLPSDEFVLQYKKDLGIDAQNAPTENECFWYCVCGAINQKSEKKCHKCGKDFDALMAAADNAVLSEHIAKRREREEAERQAAEELRIAKEKATKKRKKIAAVVLPAAAVLIVLFAVLIPIVIIPAVKNHSTVSKYNSAVELYNKQKYRKAYIAFKELGDYSQSQSKLDSCVAEWVDRTISLGQSKDADEFKNTVSLSSDQSTLVYNKVLSYIQSHNEFDYWDDCWHNTHNSEIVLNLLESLSSPCGDSGKLTRFFKDAESGSIHPVQDWIIGNPDLIESLWEYGFMKDFSQDDSMICAVLIGNWKTSDGIYYLYFKKEGDGIYCSSNLPTPTMPSNVEYYAIKSMVYVWIDQNEKVLTDVYGISFADFNSVEVYCYGDGKTYTLYR